MKSKSLGIIDFIRNNRVFITIFSASMILYLIYIIMAIFINRSFYADGSFFFVEVLNRSNGAWPYFDDSKHIRLFTNLFNQLPLSLALEMEITNKYILRLLFGAPLFLANLIGLILCLSICLRSLKKWIFLFPIATYFFFVIISEIFILNQAYFALWLYFSLFLYSISELEEIKRKDWILVTIILIFIFRSHENIIVTGPLIILAAITQLIKATKIYHKIFYIYISMGVLGAVLFAFWWQNVHPVGEQTEAYLNLLITILKQPETIIKSSLVFTIIGCFLLISGVIWKKRSEYGYMIIILSLIFMALMFTSIYMQYTGSGTNPIMEYNYRFFITIGGAGMIFLCYLIDIFKWGRFINVKYSLLVIFIIGAVQSTWQIGNNMHWRELIKDTVSVMENSENSIIDPQQSILSDTRISNRFQWSWSAPSFSIALSETNDIEKIIKPTSHKEYFTVNHSSIDIPFTKLNPEIFNIEKLLSENNDYRMNTVVHTNIGGKPQKYLTSGWSNPESWGVWSDGSQAKILIYPGSLNGHDGLRFRGLFNGFVADSQQVVDVLINNQYITSWEFNAANESSEKTLDIPKSSLNNDNSIEITFNIKKPASPKSLGISDDFRKLGISMYWFVIENVK